MVDEPTRKPIRASRALPRFLESLQVATTPQVFNPWTQHDPTTDLSRGAPGHRLDRLAAHLAIKARYLLIGEASGYQGCKVSGIPFTSERLILEGQIPRVRTTDARLTSRPRPWSEPSATTVWGTLHRLGIAEESILWNAFPWHPHRPQLLQSNRTPTMTERWNGLPVLQLLLRLHPKARIFAIGRNAEWSLQQIGHPGVHLRHPSMGGASQFSMQLDAAL